MLNSIQVYWIVWIYPMLKKKKKMNKLSIKVLENNHKKKIIKSSTNKIKQYRRLNNPRLINSNIRFNIQQKSINPSWVIRIFSKHTSENIRSLSSILLLRLSKKDPEWMRLIRLRSWCLLCQISPEILSFLEKKITLEWIVMKKCFSKNSTKMNCITN